MLVCTLPNKHPQQAQGSPGIRASTAGPFLARERPVGRGVLVSGAFLLTCPQR